MGQILSWGLAEAARGDICFTGYTVEGISAGQFVRTSAGATANTVTSEGLPSLGKGDIIIQVCNAAADSSFCVGIAVEDIPSGSYGTISTRGLYIVRTAGAYNAGTVVMYPSHAGANDSSRNVVSACAVGVQPGLPVGKMLTSTSAAGGFALILLDIGS